MNAAEALICPRLFAGRGWNCRAPFNRTLSGRSSCLIDSPLSPISSQFSVHGKIFYIQFSCQINNNYIYLFIFIGQSVKESYKGFYYYNVNTSHVKCVDGMKTVTEVSNFFVMFANKIWSWLLKKILVIGPKSWFSILNACQTSTSLACSNRIALKSCSHRTRQNLLGDSSPRSTAATSHCLFLLEPLNYGAV